MLNLFNRFPAAALVVLAMTMALAQGCSLPQDTVLNGPDSPAARATTFNAIAGR